MGQYGLKEHPIQCTLIWPSVPINPLPRLTKCNCRCTTDVIRNTDELTVIIERDSLVIIDGFQLVSGPKLSPIDNTRWIAIWRLTVQCERVTDDWPMNLGFSDWRKWFLYYSITIIKTMHTIQQYVQKVKTACLQIICKLISTYCSQIKTFQNTQKFYGMFLQTVWQ